MPFQTAPRAGSVPIPFDPPKKLALGEVSAGGPLPSTQGAVKLGFKLCGSGSRVQALHRHTSGLSQEKGGVCSIGEQIQRRVNRRTTVGSRAEPSKYLSEWGWQRAQSEDMQRS